MSECIFCKIINHEIPSQIVYEDDQVLVFKDIQPMAPYHFLAIPKQHISNICSPELAEQAGLASALFGAIQKVVAAQKLSENGFRVVINCGRDAGEAVPHLHFHILAGRALTWPPG